MAPHRRTEIYSPTCQNFYNQFLENIKMQDTTLPHVDQLEKRDANTVTGGRRKGAGAPKGSGGYRPGAGRKKGSKNIKTIMKEEAKMELAHKALLKKDIIQALPPNLRRSERALEQAIKEINEEEIESTFKKRIHLHSNKLLTAMLTSALGEQFLYKVVVAVDDDGKMRRRHVRVTDPDEIQAYLDNPLEVEGSDYFYISTKSPDITAINSLFDRMMGRPTTKVVGPNNADGSEGPIKIISVNFSSTPQAQQISAPEKVIGEVIKDVIAEENGDSTTV
jgi:hypothetical protein